MEAAGQRLIDRLAATDGDVLVMMHPYYAILAGKTASAQISALWHARHRGQDPLPPDFVAHIQNQDYALIVSDESEFFETEPALVSLIDTYYRRAEDLPPDLSPPTLSGVIVRPRVVYVPR